MRIHRVGPPSLFGFQLNLCFVGFTGRMWRQNIDSRDLGWKFSGLNGLRGFERYSALGLRANEKAAHRQPRLPDLLNTILANCVELLATSFPRVLPLVCVSCKVLHGFRGLTRFSGTLSVSGFEVPSHRSMDVWGGILGLNLRPQVLSMSALACSHQGIAGDK
jgi:hypothetical protein